ncbi:hypothetical protein QTO34_010897 [Cnephaeus nilssonii]|uniref:Uncharacterized protein n=1 Tax=Cnephaeus nilssonii TaxID=3371016 RepID=A0AA40LEN4_CNENI|nr:hypothetical protein QTO34_010897 [Eptesicus nilssonii]
MEMIPAISFSTSRPHSGWAGAAAPHLELVYLVTALVPSDTACLASSPGSSRRTAVWISRDVMVERLLRDASPAMRSKMSLTKEFMMPMALDEMPVSGCTCLSTLYTYTE